MAVCVSPWARGPPGVGVGAHVAADAARVDEGVVVALQLGKLGDDAFEERLGVGRAPGAHLDLCAERSGLGGRNAALFGACVRRWVRERARGAAAGGGLRASRSARVGRARAGPARAGPARGRARVAGLGCARLAGGGIVSGSAACECQRQRAHERCPEHEVAHALLSKHERYDTPPRGRVSAALLSDGEPVTGRTGWTLRTARAPGAAVPACLRRGRGTRPSGCRRRQATRRGRCG